MKLALRFVGFLFAAGTILFVVGAVAAAGLLWHFSKDLPDYSQLQDYEPPVVTRVHAARRRAGCRICPRAPSLYSDPGGAEAGDQRLPRRRGQELLRAWRARFRRHFARRRQLRAELRLQPPPPGRLDHHAAGGEELPAVERGVVPAQDQGSAARAQDGAHLQQRQNSRALSQRDLSRLRRLRHRLGLADLFRQVGARTHRHRSGLSRRAAEGAEQLSSVPPARARDRAPQLGARPHGRGRLHQGE